MSHQSLTAAQAARQQMRDNAGRYAEGNTASAEGSLAPGALPIEASGTTDPARHAELLESATDWGDAPVPGLGAQVKTWGAVTSVEPIADGIAFVSCEGHGGMKLSAARNEAVPAALRSGDGWYEEDDDATIVRATHPAAFATATTPTAQVYADAAQQLRDTRPDEWEQATGEVCTPQNSRTRRQEAAQQNVDQFRQQHRDDHLTEGSAHLEADLPPGWTAVQAVRPADGDTRTLLVPADRPIPRQGECPQVVDEAMFAEAIDVTDVAARRPDPEPATIHDLALDTSGLTATQQAKVASDLGQRYRTDDGQVRRLAELVAAQGITGKQVTMFGGRNSATFYLVDADNNVYPVSQTTWKACGIPDLNTPAENARLDVHRASAAVQRATSSGDREAARRARERLDAALATLRDVDDEQVARQQAFRDEQTRLLQERINSHLGGRAGSGRRSEGGARR